MLTNFFLHLHPVSIRKQGIALSYTWCMGGVTFFLFLVETVTGVLLMFYYRPTLEGPTTIFSICATSRRWASCASCTAGGACDGDHRVAPHVSRIPDRQLQAAARVQLGGRRDLAAADAVIVVHRLLVALGSVGDLGDHRRLEHGSRHAHSWDTKVRVQSY